MPKFYTDEPTSLPAASLIKRLMALLYDFMILVALWMLIGFAAVAMNGGEAVDSGIKSAALKSALLVCSYLFFAYCWTRTGQTLGMLAWRIRVQRAEGRSLSWTESLVRFFGAWISLLPLGAGYWWMLLGDEKLTWHDRWSETRVVQLPKPKK